MLHRCISATLFLFSIASFSQTRPATPPTSQLLASNSGPATSTGAPAPPLFTDPSIEAALTASPGPARLSSPSAAVTCTAPAPASNAVPAALTTASPSSAPGPAFARIPDSPRPRPDSFKRFAFSNAAMYGATIFHAFGRRSEILACEREIPLKNGVFPAGPYKGMPPGSQAKFYAIALPIDVGVTALSALARHKGWHAFEIAGPLSATTAHITAGAFKFSAGCY